MIHAVKANTIPQTAEEIIEALEALGARVYLLDDDRIALRGAEAPLELRRALMRQGAAVRAILEQRREAQEAAATSAHRRMPIATPRPAAAACGEHVGHRVYPCVRCKRPWSAHYPLARWAPLPPPRCAKPAAASTTPKSEPVS